MFYFQNRIELISLTSASCVCTAECSTYIYFPPKMKMCGWIYYSFDTAGWLTLEGWCAWSTWSWSCVTLDLKTRPSFMLAGAWEGACIDRLVLRATFSSWRRKQMWWKLHSFLLYCQMEVSIENISTSNNEICVPESNFTVQTMTSVWILLIILPQYYVTWRNNTFDLQSGK